MQYVVVKGIHGKTSQVVSGVPQGMVLGPILFLVVMTTKDQGISKSFASSFADDTTLVCQIKTEEDASMLQKKLTRVYKGFS
jgi:ribonucleases P/MRP protein subunit RPP40